MPRPGVEELGSVTSPGASHVHRTSANPIVTDQGESIVMGRYQNLCPGTETPTNVRKLGADLGAKCFGAVLGVCVCGDTRSVKQGKVYPHKPMKAADRPHDHPLHGQPEWSPEAVAAFHRIQAEQMGAGTHPFGAMVLAGIRAAGR